MGEALSCLDDREEEKQQDKKAEEEARLRQVQIAQHSGISENNGAGPPPAAVIRDASVSRSQHRARSNSRARGEVPNSSPELRSSGQYRGPGPTKTSPSLGYSEYEPAPKTKPSGDSIEARMARRDMEQAVAAEDDKALEKAIRKGKKAGWSEQEIADATKQKEQMQVKRMRDDRRRREREVGAASPATTPSAETREPPASEQKSVKPSAASVRTMCESEAPLAAAKGTTVSEEERDVILSKWQIAMSKKTVSLLQDAIKLMENAGMDQSDDHKAKIKRAREEIKSAQRVAQQTAQRRAARKDRRWDPKLGEAVNLDSMCDRYMEHGDRRSKTELRKYYETLQIQQE